MASGERPASDVCWYVGARRTGKTHLALQHLTTRADGRPFFVVDSAGAENLRALPGRVETVADALARVFSEREHTIVSPRTEEGGATLFSAVADLGGVHLLVDESARWLTGRRSCQALEELQRFGRHRGVSCALTTQHFSGDVPSWVFQVEPAFYLFRMRGRRALERLAEEFEDEKLPGEIAGLPDRKWILCPRDAPAAAVAPT